MQKSRVKSVEINTAHTSEVRTSEDVGFPKTTHDLVMHWVSARICALTAADRACAEPLAIIRYKEGGKFVPHFDANSKDPRQLQQAGGLRRMTVLGYLNGSYSGGETAFPAIGKKLTTQRGDIVFFSNLNDRGNTERLALHAGLPILLGEKWILAQWFRQHSFSKLDSE
jgi:prolyl 4-hydroxylase